MGGRRDTMCERNDWTLARTAALTGLFVLSEGKKMTLTGSAIARVFAAVGAAVVAVALAGCAASGTTDSGAATTSSSQSSAVVASSTAGSTSSSSPSTLAADGTDGWYDTWGWVSPQTAERALAAGIAPGKDVRDNLRCGTDCSESPTAAQVQAQYIQEHPDSPDPTLEAYEAATAACPGYFIRGNCYADAEAAKAAGEGE